jgi:Cyclin M transmembrane N-terminal domain
MEKPPLVPSPWPSPLGRETGRLYRKLSVVLLLIFSVAVAPSTVVSIFGKLGLSRVGENAAAPASLLRSRANNRFLQIDENQTEAATGTETNALDDCEPPPIDDEFCELHCVPEAESSWISAVPFGIQILMMIFLLGMSALFSGLTLGLMGLDRTGLEIVMEGDDPVDAANAKVIYPLRKDGNLLLCTLLLGNVAVNSLLSILLADKTGGAVGLFASTFLIVIFGEILPQAICSRHALAIGSRTVPIVRVIVCLVYVVAKPLALCLDYALGDELATTYSGAEMLKLLQIHVQEGELDKDTADAMTGALRYKDMTVSQVMTPLENTFMLSVDEKLSFEIIATIFKTGYSRIPIYEV